jgi:cardiolipin synthase
MCHYGQMSPISFFLTGRTAQDAIMNDIRKAKQTICVEMFIVGIDDAGLLLLSALRDKARSGVRVKLLADSVGSFYLYRAAGLLAEMKADGVAVSFFNHLVPWYPKNRGLWYFRNHRRSVIIDSEICYTGSVSFTDHMQEWRETMVRIESKEVAEDMRCAFDGMWNFSEVGTLRARERTLITGADYITHAPLPRRRQLYKKLIRMIREAKEEIFITTPYFIPDHRLQRELKRARERKVRVVVIVPRPSNHQYVDWAGDYDKTLYMKMGVELYFYTGMIHSKTLIVDSSAALVGSLNLDNISLRYNFESALFLTDAQAIQELRHHFVEDMALSHEITLTAWQKRHVHEKILMWLMWPFRKLL